MNWYTKQKNKTFCVLGLGLSGFACVRFLLQQGIKPVVCDSRETPPNLVEVTRLLGAEQIHLGNWNTELLTQMDFLVVSPGIDPRQAVFKQAEAAGVKLINEIELLAKATTKTLLAVTGSNGKSTVVSLLGEVLNQAGISCAVGGNIGIPALELLTDDSDCLLLELSSFQLEFCPSLQLDLAMVLNVTEDHMDRYDDLAEYAEVKRRIYRAAKVVIYNADDPLTIPEPDLAQQQISFSLQQAADWTIQDNATLYKRQSQHQINQCRLVGRHNQANILAVVAAAHVLGASADKVEQGLNHFSGLPHRCQLISKKLAVNWINDSKATNVGATLAAISGLAEQSGDLYLIAGGVAKDADLSPLKAVLETQVKQLVTMGQDGELIAALKADSLSAASLSEAVQLISQLVKPGDTVLLSPACASLDMFKNFEQRGEYFIQAVEALS